jgi:sugar lactone lactonase YvrE
VLGHRKAGLLGTLGALLACLALAPAGAGAWWPGAGDQNRERQDSQRQRPPFDRFLFGSPFLERFHTITNLGTTRPMNQDENPYGVVTVPGSVGALVQGDILVSNFNNSGNEQGRGTTLVELTPSGSLSLFAEIKPTELPAPGCPGGVGLTTALTILPNGYVVVGSLPTSNGKSETAKAGCLIVLSPIGKVVKTISGPPINGPWDLTSVALGDHAALFVTNVLNGTVAHDGKTVDKGTVLRITLDAPDNATPVVTSEQVIATGFPERTDPEALVVGPTGDGLGLLGTLLVADTAGNRIAAIPNALFRQTPLGGGGITVSKDEHLKGPLGLTIAPNGDIVTANAGDGNIVETTPFGSQVATFETTAGAGGLFGLTLAPLARGVYFVNDAANTLELLH